VLLGRESKDTESVLTIREPRRVMAVEKIGPSAKKSSNRTGDVPRYTVHRKNLSNLMRPPPVRVNFSTSMVRATAFVGKVRFEILDTLASASQCGHHCRA